MRGLSLSSNYIKASTRADQVFRFFISPKFTTFATIMHSPILQLLFASLAAVNLANGLPQEAPEGDDTQDVNLYGTPFPVFVDQFQDLNVLEDPINMCVNHIPPES